MPPKFLISNFRGFGPQGISIPPLKRFNLIVGKNNTGKSAIISAVRTIITCSKDLEKEISECKLFHDSDEAIFGIPPSSRILTKEPNGTYERTSSAFFSIIAGSELTFSYASRRWRLSRIERNGEAFHQSYCDALNDKANNIALGLGLSEDHRWLVIDADRDVVEERLAEEKNIVVSSNGGNLTKAIIYHLQDSSSNLYQRLNSMLLDELNRILQPDSLFRRIIVKQTADTLYSIAFEIDDMIPVIVSRMGSGVKTVLFVLYRLLIDLHLSPPSSNRQVYFSLEEPENNLHPTTLRRLLQAIFRFAEDRKITVLMTTHSPVVIEEFMRAKDSQIIQIFREGPVLRSNLISSTDCQGRVLDDLGVRASDILLCNAVVWVEGPSDAILIEKWIELESGGTLTRGIDYAFAFYGGSIQKHLSFEPTDIEKLIQAFKMCRNNFFIADSNKTDEDSESNAGALKLIERSPTNLGKWITKGREIENYIPRSIVNAIWSIELPTDYSYTDLYDYERTSHNKTSEKNKVDFVKQVAERLSMQDLEVLDLKDRVTELIGFIRIANGKVQE